ncbi:AraC family transcriptional regulator [Aliikangiella sp. IMCC44359]|uniref:AraC family transcriptional regulator n=1 Tax=Aliikangiella sp. IMCC44359 TaxID=3459125 RepID=UPI00403ACB7B
MSKRLYIERMKQVEKYIEKHLDESLSVDNIADIACYSTFHFHRLFKACFGESVYAYKKRLLLERSVKQLLHSKESITQIAFDAGYDSQQAFNKAFKLMFNGTPTECRQQKLSFYQPQLLIRKIQAMKVEIQKIKPIQVLSTRARGDYSDAANEAWGKLMKFMYSNKLMEKDTQMFGISHDDPSVTEPDHIRYDACVSNGQKIKTSGDVIRNVIEGGLYGVFLHKGSYQGLKETYQAIFLDWLPESGYQLRDLPPFEKYLNRDPRKTKPENLRTEIFIPITQ